MVTVTRTGETARLAARYRPAQPILAPTSDPKVYRRLALVRGVHAAREQGWEGKRAVFVSRDRVWKGVL